VGRFAARRRIAFGEDVVPEERKLRRREVTLQEAFERFRVVRKSL
jgi:hypothetical protein